MVERCTSVSLAVTAEVSLFSTVLWSLQIQTCSRAAPRRIASHGALCSEAMVLDAQPLISIEWRLETHGSDGQMQAASQPTAHAVRSRVDNRGLSGMRFGGGWRGEMKTASQASSFQPVTASAGRSRDWYLVRTLSLMAMLLWPGARRAGQ